MKLTKKKIRELIDNPDSWHEDQVNGFMKIALFKYYPVCRILGRLKVQYPKERYYFAPVANDYWLISSDEREPYIASYTVTTLIKKLYEDRDNIDYDE